MSQTGYTKTSATHVTGGNQDRYGDDLLPDLRQSRAHCLSRSMPQSSLAQLHIHNPHFNKHAFLGCAVVIKRWWHSHLPGCELLQPRQPLNHAGAVMRLARLPSAQHHPCCNKCQPKVMLNRCHRSMCVSAVATRPTLSATCTSTSSQVRLLKRKPPLQTSGSFLCTRLIHSNSVAMS